MVETGTQACGDRPQHDGERPCSSSSRDFVGTRIRRRFKGAPSDIVGARLQEGKGVIAEGVEKALSVFALDLRGIRLAFEIDLTDRIESSIALDDFGPEHWIAT